MPPTSVDGEGYDSFAEERAVLENDLRLRFAVFLEEFRRSETSVEPARVRSIGELGLAFETHVADYWNQDGAQGRFFRYFRGHVRELQQASSREAGASRPHLLPGEEDEHETGAVSRHFCPEEEEDDDRSTELMDVEGEAPRKDGRTASCNAGGSSSSSSSTKTKGKVDPAASHAEGATGTGTPQCGPAVCLSTTTTVPPRVDFLHFLRVLAKRQGSIEGVPAALLEPFPVVFCGELLRLVEEMGTPRASLCLSLRKWWKHPMGFRPRLPHTLPDWAGIMTHHLKERILKFFSLGRVSIGTDCSGAEAPLFALREIQRSVKEHCGIKFDIDHKFACDIEEHSRRFIQLNFPDCPTLFSDLTTRVPPSLASYCHKQQKVTPCPGDVDIYCAGFPCKDFSFLNNNRACLSGPHAKVFHGVCNYIKYKQPAVYVRSRDQLA
eukprot:g13842.t1